MKSNEIEKIKEVDLELIFRFIQGLEDCDINLHTEIEKLIQCINEGLNRDMSIKLIKVFGKLYGDFGYYYLPVVTDNLEEYLSSNLGVTVAIRDEDVAYKELLRITNICDCYAIVQIKSPALIINRLINDLKGRTGFDLQFDSVLEKDLVICPEAELDNCNVLNLSDALVTRPFELIREFVNIREGLVSEEPSLRKGTIYYILRSVEAVRLGKATKLEKEVVMELGLQYDEERFLMRNISWSDLEGSEPTLIELNKKQGRFYRKVLNLSRMELNLSRDIGLNDRADRLKDALVRLYGIESRMPDRQVDGERVERMRLENKILIDKQ
ncbi:hypothetical protein UT300012_21520 [Paraclostridium bifermentans]